MAKVKSLEGWFMEELKDLYSAEKQLVKALPKMAQAAEDIQLKDALLSHLEETKGQVTRLEEVFRDLGKTPKAVTCKAMKGLIEEGEEAVEKTEKCPARDAAIIGAAQRVEHYEISAYGTAHTHAMVLGLQRAEDLLQQTLDEEKEADNKLNDIAKNSINADAVQPAVK